MSIVDAEAQLNVKDWKFKSFVRRETINVCLLSRSNAAVVNDIHKGMNMYLLGEMLLITQWEVMEPNS